MIGSTLFLMLEAPEAADARRRGKPDLSGVAIHCRRARDCRNRRPQGQRYTGLQPALGDRVSQFLHSTLLV